jgi:septal ring-binding cell division protein DamX
MRVVWVWALPLLLVGCGLPPAFQIASLLIDGASYVATGKSPSDHAISAVAEKDCALWRVVKRAEICRDYPAEEPGTMVAENTAGDSETGSPKALKTMTTVPESAAVAASPFRKSKTVAVAERESEDASSAPSGDATTSDYSPEVAPAIAPAIPPEIIFAKSLKISSPVVEREGSLYLVVGSFASQDHADRAAKSHDGIDADVVPARVDGKIYYRVVAGPYEPRKVDALRKRLATAGVPDAWPIRLCPAELSTPPCTAPARPTKYKLEGAGLEEENLG